MSTSVLGNAGMAEFDEDPNAYEEFIEMSDHAASLEV